MEMHVFKNEWNCFHPNFYIFGQFFVRLSKYGDTIGSLHASSFCYRNVLPPSTFVIEQGQDQTAHSELKSAYPVIYFGFSRIRFHRFTMKNETSSIER